MSVGGNDGTRSHGICIDTIDGPGTRRLVLMRSLMLLHVILASECLSTSGTRYILLASMLLSMTGGVTGGGEGIFASSSLGVRTGILLLGQRRIVIIVVVTAAVLGRSFGTGLVRSDGGGRIGLHRGYVRHGELR